MVGRHHLFFFISFNSPKRSIIKGLYTGFWSRCSFLRSTQYTVCLFRKEGHWNEWSGSLVAADKIGPCFVAPVFTASWPCRASSQGCSPWQHTDVVDILTTERGDAGAMKTRTTQAKVEKVWALLKSCWGTWVSSANLCFVAANWNEEMFSEQTDSNGTETGGSEQNCFPLWLSTFQQDNYVHQAYFKLTSAFHLVLA